jgi:hypothetical protein
VRESKKERMRKHETELVTMRGINIERERENEKERGNHWKNERERRR